MDDREEEFIKRLKATFKVESDEHIQTISSGLLELDKNPDPQARIRILETIYREAHSLKGAARAVSLLEVEKICQSIENIFSLLKKEELDLSPVILDTLLDSVEAVANLISNDESSPVGDLLQRLSSIGSTVTNRLDDSSFKPNRKETHKSSERTQTPNGSMFADIPGQFSEISTPLKFLPKQDEERSNQGDQDPVSFSDVTHPLDVQIKSVVVEAKKSSEASAKSFDSNQPEVSFSKQRTVESNRSPHAETVRIQTNKLDSLLYQVEEMVALKMASNQRVLDLKSVKMVLDSHRKRWTNVYPEIRIMRKNSGLYYQKGNLKPNLVKLMEFLESNETILKSIDRKLKYLISTAAGNARESSLMIDDLLKDMKSVLMLPSSTILEMFPRVVRELAVSQGKKVRLSIDGGNIEIDRRILEEMKDPLIHLVRNSIDHGLETPSERTRKGKGQEGALSISVSQMGTKKVEIVVSDDGSGIDPQRVKRSAVERKAITEREANDMSEKESLNLIFKSEVSTSSMITDLSGRGLGLAIVREKVEGLGGVTIVESQMNLGTIFRIQIPVTLATFRGVLIKVGADLFIVPSANIISVGRIKNNSIRIVGSRKTITFDGQVLSLFRLSDVLELQSDHGSDNHSPFLNVLILGASDRKTAFSVDSILDEQEVLVKDLGPQLSRVRNISAAAVLGSGRVVLILNVPDLIISATKITNQDSFFSPEKSLEPAKRKSILVVEDSITSRMLFKNILESAGYDVQTAVDGVDAWAKLKTGDFDVVVSDIEMPRMDGFELTSKIRGDPAFRNLPVVIVTSLESREDKEKGIDVGANAYIVKSGFEQNSLLSVVKRLV